MMSDDELSDFERRRKLIEGIVFAPDEFVEKIYSDYGKSLVCLLYTSPSPRDS